MRGDNGGLSEADERAITFDRNMELTDEIIKLRAQITKLEDIIATLKGRKERSIWDDH